MTQHMLHENMMPGVRTYTKMYEARTHVALENMSRVRTYVTYNMCNVQTYITHEKQLCSV